MIALIATAQAAEMRCGAKGLIAAAVQKSQASGISVDPNRREDFAGIVFFASSFLGTIRSVGAKQWCSATMPGLSALLRGRP